MVIFGLSKVGIWGNMIELATGYSMSVISSPKLHRPVMS